MEIITIQPKNKKQLKALEKFLSAFNIPFEKKEKGYDPEFVKKIEEAEKEIKEGKGIRVSKENQKEFLGL